MFHTDRRDPASAREGRRGRTFFEQRIEHGFWTTRHGEFVSEDHDRSGSCVHVNCTHTRIADHERLAFGTFRIGGSACVNTDARAGNSTGIFTRSARRITGSDAVNARRFV
jgi:hypothetical protein